MTTAIRAPTLTDSGGLGVGLTTDRRIRVLVAGVALAMVLALVLGSLGLFGGGRALGASTTLTIISGDVSVRHRDSTSFVPGVDGEILTPGDAVQTGDDARAVLTYFEGSTVTIEPVTELRIDEARANARGTLVEMTQFGGRTWHVVRSLASRDSRYRVHTPASTASVRGTEFEILADPLFTTIRSTAGVVVAEIADPSLPGGIVEIPIDSGQEQEQFRHQPAAPPQPAPQPLRVVTVTVTASNSLVVDPLGRANGIAPDGRVVIQTPGARVARDGDTIVVTLPDIPDGKIGARVDRSRDGGDGEVAVRTVVSTREGVKEDISYAAKVDKSKAEQVAVAGLDLRKQGDGRSASRVLDEGEAQDVAAPKIGSLPGKNASPRGTPEITAPARATQRLEPGRSAEASAQATKPAKTDSPARESPKTSPQELITPRPQAPKTAAPKTDAPKTDAPRNDGPKNDPPKASPAKASEIVPRIELPQLPGGPRNDGPRADPPQDDAPRNDAPKADPKDGPTDKKDLKPKARDDARTDPSERVNGRPRG